MPLHLKDLLSRNRETFRADSENLGNNPADTFFSHPLLVVGILTALILLIILGYLLYSVFKPNPYGDSVHIDLHKSYKDMPRDERDLISHNLYNTLSENTDASSAKDADGTIRSDSVTSDYNKTYGISSGSFIVDFDSEQQSYLVTFEYAKKKTDEQHLSGYRVVVSCLSDPEKIIYPRSSCKTASLETYTPQETLSTHLPYYGKTANGEEYTVFARHYSDKTFYVEVASNSCGDQRLLESALASAKDWISSLDLDPADFTFEVPTTYCPGGLH